MKNLLLGLYLGVSILLIIAILLQQKGGGLSSAFGGSGAVYRSRRGAEKALFIATIVFGLLFIGGAIAMQALIR